MKKVAVFCRESNHSGADTSLQAQQAKMHKYCESKGYEVAETYSVIGDRKQGSEMLRKCIIDMKARGIETVVMVSTNRVTGTVEELAEIKKTIDDAGVSIETQDNSHLGASHLVTNFLFTAASEEEDGEE